MDLLKYNRQAWTKQVEEGNKWTLPLTSEEVAEAKMGHVKLLLTPTVNVPKSWYGDVKGKRVLCLASGGGQQGPTFAALGASVTVFDNCPAQLEKDAMVAKRDGLDITIAQGDMRDLSRFSNETFDLIFHPVSNVFVDNILVVWKEAYRVLKKGGVLLSGICNPIVYIFNIAKWEKDHVLEVDYKIPYSDLEQLPKIELEQRIKDLEPMEFGHSLADQIGGQINAGFVISGFFEDNSGWDDLLDPYIDTFIGTKASKL